MLVASKGYNLSSFYKNTICEVVRSFSSIDTTPFKDNIINFENVNIYSIDDSVSVGDANGNPSFKLDLDPNPNELNLDMLCKPNITPALRTLCCSLLVRASYGMLMYYMS